VEFGEVPRAYTILAYGQSGLEDSPHHDDQAGLFARGEMKTVRFTDEDIQGAVLRRYRPGAGASH
jgi:acyl-homoserine-lactone acylase